MKIGILNGPNLNLLGRRERSIYGCESWEKIWETLLGWAGVNRVQLLFDQSNHEGTLMDCLQEWDETLNGVIINPGGFGHTSIALRDCVASMTHPVVEVHLSKIAKRESFRRKLFLADVVEATVSGFGVQSYLIGLELLKSLVFHSNVEGLFNE